jgi:hypothetical protein
VSYWIDLEKVKPASLRDIAAFLAAELDVDVILQIAIAVLSFAAIVMVSSTGPLHRWGFVVGLISQPLWILANYRARQWGMFVLAIFYVGVWVQGILNRFF